ncbi:MAG TPA: DUF4287 domain-containing protein [Candidatus Saccharimonadales bacterium]|nr:DUF4287 domain-containing protein [Candidatus Saccharimonadales bacterium]
MSFQAYIDNIAVKTGKSANELIAEAKKKNLTEFADIIAWLKKDYDLGTGHARAIAELIRHGDKSGELNLDSKGK